MKHHNNLTDSQIHNPKGFETATNDTVLSKTIGTSATGTDGNLEWKGKAFMGVTNYKMQGFTTGATNYFYGEDISDTKAEVVAAGPAPSPCIIFFPTGFPSTITAFNTPSILAT